MASPRLLRGRVSTAGAWYVITTATQDRLPIFRMEALADATLNEMRETPQDLAGTHACVVMPDHVHWLFELGSSRSLSFVVQRFKARSAVAVNRQRGSQGRIWQSGFYDHRLRDEAELREQARYLVANPVRAGMVDSIEAYPFWWCRWIERTTDLA